MDLPRQGVGKQVEPQTKGGYICPADGPIGHYVIFILVF